MTRSAEIAPNTRNRLDVPALNARDVSGLRSECSRNEDRGGRSDALGVVGSGRFVVPPGAVSCTEGARKLHGNCGAGAAALQRGEMKVEGKELPPG